MRPGIAGGRRTTGIEGRRLEAARAVVEILPGRF
jgi:hypothetical protein